MDDHTIGFFALALGSGFMLYYTVWMICMPFVDPEHFSQAWFPPKVYGLVLPSIIGGVILVAAVVTGSIIGIRKVGAIRVEVQQSLVDELDKNK